MLANPSPNPNPFYNALKLPCHVRVLNRPHIDELTFMLLLIKVSADANV